jgi:hypothetical protein
MSNKRTPGQAVGGALDRLKNVLCMAWATYGCEVMPAARMVRRDRGLTVYQVFHWTRATVRLLRGTAE